MVARVTDHVIVGTYKGHLAFIGADGLLHGEVTKLEGRITQLQMAPEGRPSWSEKFIDPVCLASGEGTVHVIRL
eukprot:COSAG02_NODE_6188_length_3744_cov_1.721811_4_plen_74_part_00